MSEENNDTNNDLEVKVVVDEGSTTEPKLDEDDVEKASEEEAEQAQAHEDAEGD